MNARGRSAQPGESGRTPGGNINAAKLGADARSSEALPPLEGLPLPQGRTGRTPEDLLRRAGLRIQGHPRGDRGLCFKALTPRACLRPAWLGPANGKCRRTRRGAAAPGIPTRGACPVPGNREGSPGASALLQVPETPLRDAEIGAADQKNRSPRAARKKSKPLPKHRSIIPCPGFSESATPCPESAAASSRSRQRPQKARREKKRTKQSCSVRLPDCYSAAFCAASARASASLARASASFRFAAASFSFASAS